MDFLAKNVRLIRFWRRSSESVEKINRLTFSPLGDGFVVQIDKEDSKFRNISANEVETILMLLKNEYDILNIPEEFRGFQYEDDKDNFALKFYLEIDFKDYTYFSVKGLQPFKQPHYKEIMTLFSSFFE